jgi:glycosyltransferase involved in cell wall biosynthesis
MLHPALSIIIPFYNVEKHIGQCLDSVYNQDIPEEDYEVICVNDGSPDNSRQIVIEYQKKHSNLILIEHDKNMKLGAARNTGRSIAKGKYIWNVDSDDYVQSNVLKQLVSECEKDELDLLIFNFYHSINGVEKLNQAYPFSNSQLCSGLEFTKKYCLDHFSEISPVWTQIYKLDFLEKNNLSSPEYNYAEDAPFTFKALFLARRVKSIVIPCYVYRIGGDSIGTVIEIQPTAHKLYEKCFISTKELVKVRGVLPANQNIVRMKFREVYKYTISLFPQYTQKMSKDEFLKFKSLCRNNFFRDLEIIFLLSRKNFFYYITKVIGPF